MAAMGDIPKRRRGRQPKWLPSHASDDQKRLFAAALIVSRHGARAFREVFGKERWMKDAAERSVSRWAHELTHDEVVSAELARLRDEALASGAKERLPDLRALAIRDVRNLRDVIEGDYAGIFANFIDKPAVELDELPPWLRGVIVGVKTRDKDGVAVVSEITLCSKDKASERLQRWAELSSQQEDSAFGAVAVAVDELPAPPVATVAPPVVGNKTGTHVDILGEQE